mgnify:CR=1 FL=1
MNPPFKVLKQERGLSLAVRMTMACSGLCMLKSTSAVSMRMWSLYGHQVTSVCPRRHCQRLEVGFGRPNS